MSGRDLIQVRVEGKRGCGYRKPGGFYLISDNPGRGCGKLPIPLDVCPCCGHGIKPSRGWTWINGAQLAAERPCEIIGTAYCAVCPLSKPMGRVGLLWIGEAYYKTPADFQKEADTMGLSRRISRIPRGFKLGETWVWFAHRKAINNPDGTHTAAVFRVFKPQRIEYVVRGTETDEEIERLVDRGITPVEVRKPEEQTALAFQGEKHE